MSYAIHDVEVLGKECKIVVVGYCRGEQLSRWAIVGWEIVGWAIVGWAIVEWAIVGEQLSWWANVGWAIVMEPSISNASGRRVYL